MDRASGKYSWSSSVKSACMVQRILWVWAVLALLGSGSAAAAPPLSLDQIFAPSPPWGEQPSKIVWSPDGTSFLYVLPSQDVGQAVPLRQYDVRSGRSRVVVEPASYGPKSQTPGNVLWSPDGKNITFTIRGVLYERDMSTGLDRIIARDVGDVQWSPQGKALAYTHNADIYVAVLTPKLHIERLTLGGVSSTILNGDLDWVYPEELSTQHGFAWSPDGREIAYMQMDERDVTNFPIVDFLPADNTLSYQRYPLAGERNPHVTLHVADVTTLASRLIYDAGARDEYLPFFGWRPGSHMLVAELIDRAQQHLRVVQWEDAAGAPVSLYQQSDSRWVDDIPLPTWLPGGESLWMLERDNAVGLYLRNRSARLMRLNGAYRVDQILGVSARNRLAYVSAAYPSRRDRSVLAISLSGGSPRNLTPEQGNHMAVLSPVNDLFVDTHSTLDDPPQTDLVSTGGVTRATLAPRNEALRAQMLPVQMLSVDSSYGPLDAYLIKPPNFDPGRKYPVIVYAYGGPELPTTANVFGYARGLYHQLLARHGFIVFSIDGPASQIDNESHVRLLYHNFGPGSLLGQETGANYLRSLAYVDASRIGIWGWSFGGYETVYALTHSSSFKAGAAGAPVTDWHYYDSIYTERYMGSPQNNASAYDQSSALKAAPALRGDLLISHGTSDDNVHMANSIALLQSLIAADKTNVDFMAYPRQKHGFVGLDDLRRLYRHMLEWWSAHL
jgi:dipeptidyl-peptidase-4